MAREGDDVEQWVLEMEEAIESEKVIKASVRVRVRVRVGLGLVLEMEEAIESEKD